MLQYSSNNGLYINNTKCLIKDWYMLKNCKNSTTSPLQSFVQIKDSMVTHMNNNKCDKFLHSSQECECLTIGVK